ncbi:MAG: transposase [Flavobacterium sp.]|nr:MAG: transposase [Flavobacterium sp.]
MIKQKVEIRGNCIKLPKLGLIKFFNSRAVESKIKNATIREEADGWYISLVFEGETTELESSQQNTGLDLGLNYFAVTSNDERIDNPRTYKKYEKALAILNRSRDRKKKGGSNRGKVVEKIGRLHQKIANVRKDFLDKVSTKLIRENQAIVVEDLKISNLVKKAKPVLSEDGKTYLKNNRKQKSGLSKSILDSGWGIFTNMLEYKAKWYGRTFVKVAPQYTSRDCSNCNYRLEKLALSIREWQCPECNTIHHRDHNASINILNKWRLGESPEA